MCSLYCIPTARLLDNRPISEIMAQASIVSRRQKRGSDSTETDSQERGGVYMSAVEQEAVNYFDPSTGLTSVCVRKGFEDWMARYHVL